MENEIYCDADPMNPLCCLWTFHGAKQWYETKQEAEEAYKDFCKKNEDILQKEMEIEWTLTRCK